MCKIYLYILYDKCFHKLLINYKFINNINKFSVCMCYTYFKYLYYLSIQILLIEYHNLRIFFCLGWNDCYRGCGKIIPSSIIIIKVRILINIFTNIPLFLNNNLILSTMNTFCLSTGYIFKSGTWMNVLKLSWVVELFRIFSVIS